MSIDTIIASLKSSGVEQSIIDDAMKNSTNTESEDTNPEKEDTNPESLSQLLQEIRMSNEIVFQNQLQQSLLAAGSALNKKILEGNDVDGDKLLQYMKEMKSIFSI